MVRARDAAGRRARPVTGRERGMAAEDGEGDPAAGLSPEAVAAAGGRAGKPLREIAVDLYGRERVDTNWHADSAMRSKLRRPVQRACDEAPAPGDGTGPRLPGRR